MFHALEPEDIRKITSLMLRSVNARLSERRIRLVYDDAVVELLATEGYDANYGARPLRRTIQRSVEDALSEEIIAGHIALGDDVRLFVTAENKIGFEKATGRLEAPTTEETVKA